jgi:hypothetical protein
MMRTLHGRGFEFDRWSGIIILVAFKYRHAMDHAYPTIIWALSNWRCIGVHSNTVIGLKGSRTFGLIVSDAIHLLIHSERGRTVYLVLTRLSPRR